jgi:hypothetical protein
MTEDLRAEHARLLEQMAELTREHRQLESNPKDIEAHQAHRAKLRAQIDELQAHANRIRRGSQ